MKNFFQLVLLSSRGLTEASAVRLMEISNSVKPNMKFRLWGRMSLCERGYLASLAANSLWSKFYDHVPGGVGRGGWRELYHDLRQTKLQESESHMQRVETVSLFDFMGLLGTGVARRLTLSRSLAEQLFGQVMLNRRAEFDRLASAANPHLTEQDLDAMYGASKLLLKDVSLSEAMLEFGNVVAKVNREEPEASDGVMRPEDWHHDKIVHVLRVDDKTGGTRLLSDLVQDIVRRRELEWTIDDIRKLLGKFVRNKHYEPVTHQLNKIGAMARIENSPWSPLELFVIKLLYSYARRLRSDDEVYDRFSTAASVKPQQQQPFGGEAPESQESLEGESDLPSRVPAGRKRQRHQIKSLQVVSMPPSMSR